MERAHLFLQDLLFFFSLICPVYYVIVLSPSAAFPSVSSYMSFRLLGSALPLLSAAQLKDVLSGEVMMNYGEHVVSAQVSATV